MSDQVVMAKVDGVEQALFDVQQFTKNPEERLTKVYQTIGGEVVREAKSNAPVVTGALRNSVKYNFSKSRGLEIRSLFYGRFVELRGNQFIKDAIQTIEDKFPGLFSEMFKLEKRTGWGEGKRQWFRPRARYVSPTEDVQVYARNWAIIRRARITGTLRFSPRVTGQSWNLIKLNPYLRGNIRYKVPFVTASVGGTLPLSHLSRKRLGAFSSLAANRSGIVFAKAGITRIRSRWGINRWAKELSLGPQFKHGGLRYSLGASMKQAGRRWRTSVGTNVSKEFLEAFGLSRAEVVAGFRYAKTAAGWMPRATAKLGWRSGRSVTGAIRYTAQRTAQDWKNWVEASNTIRTAIVQQAARFTSGRGAQGARLTSKTAVKLAQFTYKRRDSISRGVYRAGQRLGIDLPVMGARVSTYIARERGRWLAGARSQYRLLQAGMKAERLKKGKIATSGSVAAMKEGVGVVRAGMIGGQEGWIGTVKMRTTQDIAKRVGTSQDLGKFQAGFDFRRALSGGRMSRRALTGQRSK